MGRRNEFERVVMEEIGEAVQRSGYLEWSLAGDLHYAATCIRQCAKQMQGDDASDRDVKRHNMRACANRLARLARELPVVV